MDAGINPTSGDLTGERIDSLANAIYLRLMIPLGSYWADATLGSLLYTLRREKDRPRVGRLAEQYARDALKPLLDDGRALAIEIAHEQLHDGWLRLVIEATQADGQARTFQHNVRVI